MNHKGVPCRAWAIKGGTVCRQHGGNLVRVQNAANFRIAKTKAERQALSRLREKTGKNGTDAIAEIERLAAEVIVFKDICRERLELLWAQDEIRYSTSAGEQLRAEVALYERALDRCEKILATHVRLGIAKRREAINEAEQLLLVSAIRNILNRLGLSQEQQRIAVQVVPEELRAISGEIVEGELVG